MKTAEELGFEAHSLAYNLLKGRGVCWSSKMELEKITSTYSLT
jgi:hypothetical protein